MAQQEPAKISLLRGNGRHPGRKSLVQPSYQGGRRPRVAGQPARPAEPSADFAYRWSPMRFRNARSSA